MAANWSANFKNELKLCKLEVYKYNNNFNNMMTFFNQLMGAMGGFRS